MLHEICQLRNPTKLGENLRRDSQQRARQTTKPFGDTSIARGVRTKVGDLKKDTGEFTSRDEEKAEILSDQYYKTFTQEDPSNMPPATDRELMTHPLTNIELTEEEVLKKLSSLRVYKSPGRDGLHPRLLREMGMYYANHSQPSSTSAFPARNYPASGEKLS